MQIYEMGRAGLSYVNDPKQVVFTDNQYDIVNGVLDGIYDVGFVRTNQIEITTDSAGEFLDPDLFKVIDPKIFVMDDGELFPFLHSTDILPEWPFSSLMTVPEDVQRAVQSALIDFGQYALMGKIQDCSSGSRSTNASDWCNDLELKTTSLRTPCNATEELSALAAEASRISRMSNFRPARSYFYLRAILEEAGFLIQNGEGWQCLRPSNLHEGITCPPGHFKRDIEEFENGCKHIGLTCGAEDHTCFCKPCVKAFDVDVYHLDDRQVDPHLVETYGASLPGCKKMEICGVLKQRESITMRIYDNMLRDGANVTAICTHGDDDHNAIPVTNIPGTYGYEFTITDNQVRVHVVEVFINGILTSQSPIRIAVEEADCDSQYGEESNRVPDSEGNCVCASYTHEIAGSCIESAGFVLIIFSAVFVAVGILLFFYIGYKKKQSDSVWHINVEELHFNEPPEIIGTGGFGVVILGQYRGTKVAVKRVLPPSKLSKGYKGTNTSRKSDDGEAAAITTDKSRLDSTSMEPKRMFGIKKYETMTKRGVKFEDSNKSGDIESQETVTKSQSMELRGGMSGSNKDWERLLMANHSNNDVLKLLESATSSAHGREELYEVSTSKSFDLVRFLPMCLRFDAHSQRVTEFVNEMRMLSRLRHPCITTVMGAVVANALDPMLVMEYMEYGSLHDLLHNETMTLGGEIILQVARDVVQGIQFLHTAKPPILHGDLKAKNILVDSRFRAKVADFGFSHFKCTRQRNVLQGTPFYMAPEYLRRRSEYTTACDIYSLAMIVYEIYARAGPFEGEDPRKILPKVCHPRLNKRPPIPESCPPKMVDLMKKCWSSNAFFRPSAKDIDYVLVEMNSTDAEPLSTATERARDTLKRKPTSLYDVFPKHIADALNAGKKVEAESHEIVTIVFSDIVGFTTISDQFSPLKVSNMLDRLYQAFDKLADEHGIFKVETIGDAYMGVTNLDGSEYDTHVKQVAEYAQEAIRAASQVLIDEEDPSKGFVRIRVGFHSGPVVSNVIGSLNPRYGLFGDTVNTALSMESNSMPGKIHCTCASAELLQTQAPDIPLTLRGMIKIQGKGKMKTYWVGCDDLISMPLSTLTIPHANTVRIECDCKNDLTAKHETKLLDTVGTSEHETKLLDTVETAEHKSHQTLDTKMMDWDDECVSQSTHDTEQCGYSCDSGHEHFIQVHTQSQHTSCASKIRMDGVIEGIGDQACYSS